MARDRRLSPEVLMLLSFVLLQACEPEPGPCPAAERRFDPGVGAENTFVWDYDEDMHCPGGGTYDNGEIYCVADCNADVCADGYVGDYCVYVEDFEAWLADDCPGCVGGVKQIRDLDYCSVLCEP